MEHKTYLGRVNHFSTESQLFQYGVNFSSKRVNQVRLYSQPFSGVIVNFFRMEGFM